MMMKIIKVMLASALLLGACQAVVPGQTLRERLKVFLRGKHGMTEQTLFRRVTKDATGVIAATDVGPLVDCVTDQDVVLLEMGDVVVVDQFPRTVLEIGRKSMTGGAQAKRTGVSFVDD